MLPASFRVVAFSIGKHWWQGPKWFAPAAIAAVAAGEVRLTPAASPVAGGVMAGATALKGKSVRTASGLKLGRVKDFAFSVTTGEVTEITVASSPSGPCWPRECVIERAAVVRVELKQIIVRDSIAPLPDPRIALKSLHS